MKITDVRCHLMQAGAPLHTGWTATGRTALAGNRNWLFVTLHTDAGLVGTKPYVSSAAYIDRMSDHCGGCRFDPTKRTGEDACPFTAGYWMFLHRHRDRFLSNHRMRRSISNLDRLAHLDVLVADNPDLA